SCMNQPGINNAGIHSDLQFVNVVLHHCGVPFDSHYYADDPSQGYARENSRAAYYHGWYAHTGGSSLINSEVYKNAGTGVGPDGADNVFSGNYIHDNSNAGLYISGGDRDTIQNNVFY